MKKTIFVFLALAIFMFAAPQESWACSCIVKDIPEKQQVLESYKGSTAVFSGEVIEIIQSDENTKTIKLKLVESWKMALGEMVTVTTANDSAMCGYEFVIGKKYLVYANESSGELFVNNCSRTSEFALTSKDFKYLKKYKIKNQKET